MTKVQRSRDITPLEDESFDIFVDGEAINAVPGETVLGVMMAAGKRQLMQNDHQKVCGAYCGMGVCHCCHVKINNRYKQRACQTPVEAGMKITTNCNRIQEIGVSA